MSNLPSFLIRDGLESDIEPCLALDHRYTTDYVWQMSIHTEGGAWQIGFAPQRLPRTLETRQPLSPERLRLGLKAPYGFLVAQSKGAAEIAGYLVLQGDPAHDLALIHDIVVDAPYRGQRVGTRLVNAARRWAEEHHLRQLMAETRTQNYPGILFLQQLGMTFCGFNERYFANQDIALFFCQTLR